MHVLKKYYGFILVFIFGLIPLLPLFHTGLPITHDGQDHVARIANFYLSLSEGNTVPRWAGNLNWGFGHPILMFLYPFPSYFASAIHYAGFSLVDSVKIVFGLSFILSGFAMYLWIRNVLGEQAGIISGVLYMLAPYRFVDLYVRGAIGEHVAFIFAPLVFYFLHKISRVQGKGFVLSNAGLSVSVLFLLLSHNALALMFLPFAGLYALLLIYKSQNKKLLAINYSLFTFFGFGLSAFFLIPAFFEGKYTLRNIVTGGGEYKSSFVSMKDFFIPSWSFGGSQILSKQIGFVQIFAIILSFFAFKKISRASFSASSKVKKDKKSGLYILSGIVLIESMFLMTSSSSFIWERITLIQKFQFPWRLLSLVVFAAAILSSFSIFFFKNKKHASVYAYLLCFAALVLYFPYYQTNGYLNKSESFYTGIYKSTTDTGESSPVWSVRFMEKEATKSAEFITGSGTIEGVSRTSTSRIYRIISNTPNARIKENTLYFPNWEVTVNRKKADIVFQDPDNRGLITYHVPKRENIVEIKFEDTKLRILSNTTSILSMLALLVLFFILVKLKHEK
jgi:hypothetical protein